MSSRVWFVTTMTALAVLSGCSSSSTKTTTSSSTPVTSGTPEFSTKTPGQGASTQFSSIEDLRSALGAHGYTCTDWQTLPGAAGNHDVDGSGNGLPDAASMGLCMSDGITAYLYASADDRTPNSQRMEQGSPPNSLIIGDNWIVQTKQGEARNLADQIGGEAF